jgi:hypothetical protein
MKLKWTIYLGKTSSNDLTCGLIIKEKKWWVKLINQVGNDRAINLLYDSWQIISKENAT